MKRLTLTLALVLATALSYGCAEDNPTLPHGSSTQGANDLELAAGSSPLAGGAVPRRGVVIRLLGDAEGYEGTVSDIDGDGVDDPAVCFDVDILDASGKKIGTATDCLSEITPVDGGLALVGTTIFRLQNGTFTSRGYTTVQPVTTNAPTPATHTTGAIPMDGANGIIAGTGAFKNFQAQVRLSGAVNLSRLESDGRIAFDCLFAVSPLHAGGGI